MSFFVIIHKNGEFHQKIIVKIFISSIRHNLMRIPYSFIEIICWEGSFLEFSFGFIISIIIAIYLAIDAPKHNKNPWLWGILGFLFGPIVLGIYLIVTGRKVAGWIILVISILLIVLVILLFAVGMYFIFNGM